MIARHPCLVQACWLYTSETGQSSRAARYAAHPTEVGGKRTAHKETEIGNKSRLMESAGGGWFVIRHHMTSLKHVQSSGHQDSVTRRRHGAPSALDKSLWRARRRRCTDLANWSAVSPQFCYIPQRIVRIHMRTDTPEPLK